MHIFHRRPLAFAAVCSVICAVLLYFASAAWHLGVLLFLSAVLVLLTVFCLIRKRLGKRMIALFLCVAAMLLSSFSSYQFFKLHYPEAQSYVQKTCVIEGYVTERLNFEGHYGRFFAKIERVDQADADFCMLLEFDYPSSLQPGERFRITCVPRAFEESAFFDEAEYYISEGCVLAAEIADREACSLLDGNVSTISIYAAKTNQMLSQRLANAIGREGGGLASALLLGNRTHLPANATLNFRYAGVSHLLALSGLHVSVLLGLFELLLRLLRIPKKGRTVIVPLLAIGYLLLTGCSLSACRAVFMACTLYLSLLWRSDYDPFTALSLSLAGVLLVMPNAVLDVGMWLSYVAAGAMIVFMPAVRDVIERLRERLNLPRWILRFVSALTLAVCAGVIVNIALLPLLASVYGEISLWSIPATLLLSLPVALMIYLSALALVLPFVPYLPDVCDWLGGQILNAVSELYAMDCGMLSICGEITHVLLGILVISLILLAVLPLRSWCWGLLLPVICTAIIFSSLWSLQRDPAVIRPQTLTFESESGRVTLHTEGGRAVVINDTSWSASYAYEIEQTAKEAHCTAIDSLVLCRYYDQAPYFVFSLAERIRIRTLCLPTPKTDAEQAAYDRICEEAKRFGIGVVTDTEYTLQA